MKLKYLLMTPLLLTSLQSFAGPYEILADGRVKLEACGVAPGTKIEFINKTDGTKNESQAAGNGCARATVGNAAGDTFLVKNLSTNQNIASITIPKSTGGGSQQGQQQQRPPQQQQQQQHTQQPPQQQQQQAPVDNRKVWSDQKIVNIADNAARSYANSVVRSLGQIEKIRRNVLIGFNQAASDISNFSSGIQSVPDYQQASQIEDSQGTGRRDGEADGRSRGQSDASSLARADVARAVETVVSNEIDNDEPNFTGAKRTDLHESISQFNGMRPNISAPAGMDQRLRQIDAELQSQLRTIFVPEQGIVMSDGIFKTKFYFYDLWSQQDKSTLVLSNYRGEYAFSGWKSGELRNPNDPNPSIYNQMIDPNASQDSDRNAIVFANAFKSIYDSIIADKWNREVLTDMPDVQGRARGTYMNEYRKLAAEQGRYDRYVRNYSGASIGGYRQSFADAYSSSFDGFQNQSQNGAFLASITASIQGHPISANFSMGDKLDVTLTSAKNLGKIAGEVDLIIKVDNATVERKTQKIAGYDRLRAPVKFEGVATVPDQTSADQTHTIQVFHGNNLLNAVQVKTNLESLVVKLASTSDEGIKGKALSTITRLLSEEWKKAGIGNQYNNGKGDKMLERFANAYRSLNGEQRSNMRKFSKDILNTINDGKKPSGFFATTKDDYEGAMKLLKDAGFSD